VPLPDHFLAGIPKGPDPAVIDINVGKIIEVQNRHDYVAIAIGIKKYVQIRVFMYVKFVFMQPQIIIFAVQVPFAAGRIDHFFSSSLIG